MSEKRDLHVRWKEYDTMLSFMKKISIALYFYEKKRVVKTCRLRRCKKQD